MGGMGYRPTKEDYAPTFHIMLEPKSLQQLAIMIICFIELVCGQRHRSEVAKLPSFATSDLCLCPQTSSMKHMIMLAMKTILVFSTCDSRVLRTYPYISYLLFGFAFYIVFYFIIFIVLYWAN